MTVPIPKNREVFAHWENGTRDVYYSDLLKIKKLFLPVVGGDHSRVLVRQHPDHPRDMDVRLTLDDGTQERYTIRIVEAEPLASDEYVRHSDGLMKLIDDPSDPRGPEGFPRYR